jgi:uncharacterized membrane protein
MADNSAFCPNCGAAVAQVNPASSAAPPPPPAASYSATSTASAPLEENVAGALAYLVVPAIVFLLIEPYNRNRFVRFHSFQCLFLHLVPVIGWFVVALMWPLYSLAVLALWLLLVIKAYQHQIYKLPVVGDLAEKQAGV